MNLHGILLFNLNHEIILNISNQYNKLHYEINDPAITSQKILKKNLVLIKIPNEQSFDVK